MGQGRHLFHGGPIAEALAAGAVALATFLLLQPFGDLFELLDQFAQGHGPLQGRWGYGAPQQMAFGPGGQLQAGGDQPALAVEIKVKGVFDHGFGQDRAGLQQFGLQPHQHRGREERFARFGQIVLIAAALAPGARGHHQPGQGNARAELVEEAIDDGNDIHIPGVDVTPFGRILEQPDRKPGASFSQSQSTHLSEKYRLGPLTASHASGKRQIGGASPIRSLGWGLSRRWFGPRFRRRRAAGPAGHRRRPGSAARPPRAPGSAPAGRRLRPGC